MLADRERRPDRVYRMKLTAHLWYERLADTSAELIEPIEGASDLLDRFVLLKCHCGSLGTTTAVADQNQPPALAARTARSAARRRCAGGAGALIY